MGKEEKLEDWQYMLKTAIYTTLIDYTQPDGYSMPCATRTKIENDILRKFTDSLKKGGYVSREKYDELEKKHNQLWERLKIESTRGI